MIVDEDDAWRRSAEQRLAQTMIETAIAQHIRLRAELEQELTAIERPEVREFAEEFAGYAINQHRHVSREMLHLALRASERRTNASALPEPASDGPRRIWTRLAWWRRGAHEEEDADEPAEPES